MMRFPLVGAVRPAAVAIAACVWVAALPAHAQAVAQTASPAVPMSYAQVRQLLQGGLVQVFEQAVATNRPIETLLKEREARPGDVRLCVEIAAYYSRQNDAVKTMEYLALPSAIEPGNPETCCLVASYIFGVVSGTRRPDERPSPDEVARAVAQVDNALRAKPDFLSALLYKTMLLLVQADLDPDPARQAAIRQEAEAVRTRFSAFAKAAGVADPTADSRPIAPAPFPAAPNALRAGGEIRPPVRTVYVEPAYPEAARQAGVQGVVILEVLIGENGKVQDSRIMRSIPPLDQAARDAVRQWEFSPTMVNGAPVSVMMTVTVKFTPKLPAAR